MQDKLLFAAGLVALLIGLFVGIKSDNVRKTAEQNLAEINRQVVSVEQQLRMEEDRNKTIIVKLSDMEKKLGVSADKLEIANNWYAGLQDTNKMLASDIYTIRLAMVEVLADLKDAPSAAEQKSISEKVEKLVRMLDDHNAPGSAGQSASKEAEVTPEPQTAGEAMSNGQEGKPEKDAGVAEKAPAVEAPGAETDKPANADQAEEAAPAKKPEKSDTGAAPQAEAPAEKGQDVAPDSHEEEKKEGAVRL